MDLTQRKLTKDEWDTMEVPVSAEELNIINLIIAGYDNVNIQSNDTKSLLSYAKMEYTQQIEDYLYKTYFSHKVNAFIKQYNINFIIIQNTNKQHSAHSNKKSSYFENNKLYINVSNKLTLKTSDNVRIGKLENITNNSNIEIYEFIMFSLLENMIKSKSKNTDNDWMYSYYTINMLLKNNINKINTIVYNICKIFMIVFEEYVNLDYIITNAPKFIEKNKYLLKYRDTQLYFHQKQLFSSVKIDKPKIILYSAPTGTGKTLSPIGLKQKVIFLCAARHVGLALARSAISANKHIAFAFGCSSSDDIRLHYSAAKEYTVNKRSGQIWKVDNTVGDKVDIIICDIRSYIIAMHYMLAFNDANSIITYWDEPTITLDYENHPIHSIIKTNWRENLIPNLVLSSATLPKQYSISHTITDFQSKFPDSIIIDIHSYECKKTIPLINNNGYVEMPHYLSNDYSDVLSYVKNCECNKSLLRYLDLKEISKFIKFIETNNYVKSSAKINRSFISVDDVNMENIKLHYLKALKNIKNEYWNNVYSELMADREYGIIINKKVDSKGNKITYNQSPDLTAPGAYFTTRDAHTLTDGATIYVAHDLEKIAKFCIQQAKIPNNIISTITDKIEYNNNLNVRINEYEEILNTEEQKIAGKLSQDSSNSLDKKKTKALNNMLDREGNVKRMELYDKISMLKSMMKQPTIDDIFIPNKLAHKMKWCEHYITNNEFTSDISDNIIMQIMMLKDVSDSWKVLLMLGIGVIAEHKSISYTEIIKKLADEQKLYLLIAESDYIYGTNYQLCHGYLSKDMSMTQEKIIQWLGRIGRNNIQQQYTARFRDNEHIKLLFSLIDEEDKQEVRNLNLLFNSKNLKWIDNNYEEVEEPITDINYEKWEEADESTEYSDLDYGYRYQDEHNIREDLNIEDFHN